MSFHSFIKNEIAGREILVFNSHPVNCFIDMQIKLETTGKTGPNKLKKKIEMKFPDVSIE
jgi:hypothetical protein